MAVWSKKRRCAVDANNRHLSPGTGDRASQPCGQFIKVRDDGDARDKPERRQSVPYLGKVEQLTAEVHCSRGTACDDTAGSEDTQDSLPGDSALQRLNQVEGLAASEEDESLCSNVCVSCVVNRTMIIAGTMFRAMLLIMNF